MRRNSNLIHSFFRKFDINFKYPVENFLKMREVKNLKGKYPKQKGSVKTGIKGDLYTFKLPEDMKFNTILDEKYHLERASGKCVDIRRKDESYVEIELYNLNLEKFFAVEKLCNGDGEYPKQIGGEELTTVKGKRVITCYIAPPVSVGLDDFVEKKDVMEKHYNSDIVLCNHGRDIKIELTERR